ncbi:MAG: hypothetical protein ACI38V_04465 [Bacteroides sp.]
MSAKVKKEFQISQTYSLKPFPESEVGAVSSYVLALMGVDARISDFFPKIEERMAG